MTADRIRRTAQTGLWIDIVFFVLFALGAVAAAAKSEAVLPAYLVGLVLASVFAQQRDTVRRLRTTVFALLRRSISSTPA